MNSLDRPNPPVTPSGGYVREHETRGFKMKAAYDKARMLHLEPEAPTDEAPFENIAWREGYRHGVRDGVWMVAMIAIALGIVGFVLYVGCK